MYLKWQRKNEIYNWNRNVDSFKSIKISVAYKITLADVNERKNNENELLENV